MTIPTMPLALLAACAPQISPITLAAIVQQESHGEWLAIHDNTAGRTLQPATVEDAVLLAQPLILSGHSVDLGIAQINSANLARLDLNVRSAFDPCKNLHAAQTLLLEGWQRTGSNLSATLAIYHIGCLKDCSAAQRSMAAAYNGRVYGAAGVTVPAIPDGHLARWVLKSEAPKENPNSSPETSSLTPHGTGLSSRSAAKMPR